MAQVSQDPKSVPVVIYDFDASHPDFEAPSCIGGMGMVDSTLGPDGKPSNAPGGPCAKSDIRSWFTKGPDNARYCTDLPLSPAAGNATLFQHQDSTFFPIDDAPTHEKVYVAADDKQIHNFHFCLEMHASFQYRGGEVFEFLGDDDIWVFINKKLAVDIGGVHPALAGSVDLDRSADRLGLQVGNYYAFDFFYCERKTTRSRFNLKTSIDILPAEMPRPLIGDAAGVAIPPGSTINVDHAAGPVDFTGLAERKQRESLDCESKVVENTGVAEGEWTLGGRPLPRGSRVGIAAKDYPEGLHKLVFSLEGRTAEQMVNFVGVRSRAVDGYYQDRDGDGRIETAVIRYDSNFAAAPASVAFVDPLDRASSRQTLSQATAGTAVTYALAPFAPGTRFPSDSLASIAAQPGHYDAHRVFMADSVGPVAVKAASLPAAEAFLPAVLEVAFSEPVSLVPGPFPFEIVRGGVPIPSGDIVLAEAKPLGGGRFRLTFAPGSAYPVPGDSLRVLDAAARDAQGNPSRMRIRIPVDGDPARREAEVAVLLRDPHPAVPRFGTRPLENPVILHGGGVCLDCGSPRFAGLPPASDPARVADWGPTWDIVTEYPFRYSFAFFDNAGHFVNRAEGAVDAAGLQAIRSATRAGDSVRIAMTFLPVSREGQPIGTGAYIARGWVETSGKVVPGPQGEPVHVDPGRKDVFLRFGYIRKE